LVLLKLEIFKISVGSIAGCMVMDGKIARNAKKSELYVMVVHAGELSALKRFKDDVKEVAKDTIVVFKSKVIMT
jgi:translation initiation factor IF-2